MVLLGTKDTSTQPTSVNLEPRQARTLVNVASRCQEKKELFPYWKAWGYCSMKDLVEESFP